MVEVIVRTGIVLERLAETHQGEDVVIVSHQHFRQRFSYRRLVVNHQDLQRGNVIPFFRVLRSSRLSCDCW